MFEKNYKAKDTRYFKPYLNGKDMRGRKIATLKATGPGIYFIKEAGEIVYIGKSHSDLKKTLYRHFQQWTDYRQDAAKKYSLNERVTYKENLLALYAVRVIFLKRTAAEIDKIETALILKHHPRDNKQKLGIYTQAQLYKAEEQVSFENLGSWQAISDENPF